MNYYKRHIGDYMKDASHLSLLEHGVYVRLMDVYYTRETSLPVDQVARLIGAKSKDEKEALQAVLSEFFKVVNGCYMQTRCDIELSTMQKKAITNKDIGRLGGRPKNKTQKVNYGNPKITQTVSTTNPDVTLATSHYPLATNSVSTDTGSEAANLTKAELWASGKSLLENAGMPKAQCGSFVGKLVKDFGDLIVVEAVRLAVVTNPADPAEYLKAACQIAAGQRKAPEPEWRKEQRERTQIAAPGVAVGAKPAHQFFNEVEAKNVIALRLG